MRLWVLDRVRRLSRLIAPRRRRAVPGHLTGVPDHSGLEDRGLVTPVGSPSWDVPAGRHRRDSPSPPGSSAPVTGPTGSTGAPPVSGWTPAPRRNQPAVSRPGRQSRPGASAVRSGSARARVRENPDIPVPREAEATAVRAEAISARAATAGTSGARSGRRSASAAVRSRLPFTAPRSPARPPAPDGRRHCGSIERILWRQWDAANPPPAAVVAAVDRLAELPERIKERLADGLDAIYVGPGGVPELDDMTSLRGVRLPSGRASWDACAGAYGERKIVVGSQPSPTPDVMCHEIGHALDDLDSPPGKWQSDSAEFRALYEQCKPHLASDFHRQPGGLGRKEFFADAFAAIASRQRPALVDMLSGETRTALRVMLYFNRRYDI